MIKYTINHIPKGTACNRRPALPMTATTITIHNTGNESSTAANERAWLTNPTNGREASYHIVVDQLGAIECLPLSENAWHSGDGRKAGSGNRTSIGIEICESGDYAKVLDNAVQLVAEMLKQRGWGVDRLRRHYDWSGKICPRLMHDGGKWTGWSDFKNRVSEKLKGGDELDKATVYVNGTQLVDGLYDSKAGIVYVPVRAVSEALGAKVKWTGSAKRVDLTK